MLQANNSVKQGEQGVKYVQRGRQNLDDILFN